MSNSKSIDKLKEQTNDIYERLQKTDLGVTKFDEKPEPIPRFHSGSYKLDHVLGGGWPWGRLIELYGTESSAKTTLAVHAVKEAQNEGKTCGYVDAEHSLDPKYAFDGIGADQEALIFQQPRSGEQALECVETMVCEGVNLVVLDSVAALVPQAELEGDIGDDHVGLLARLMSQTLRRLAGTVMEKGATVIFINQIRAKIGDFFQDETTPGGRALKFYSSIRLRLSPSTHEKEEGETIGNKIYARATKNKTAPPFRSGKLMIRYGEGIDRAFELRSEAESDGIVERAGSWYKINGETICQGATALEQMIRENAQAEVVGNVGLRDYILDNLPSPTTQPAVAGTNDRVN
jgi:recombination protein RecA